MALILTDEIGNPFPAGVQVFVYPANQPQNPSTLVGTDWTQVGGLCPFINLSTAVNYVATCVGRLGPSNTASFPGVTGTTTVQWTGYVSPSMTIAGWATKQTQLWPVGPAWWGDDAKIPGGVAWAFAYGFAAVLQFLDASTQAQIGASRLQSSVGLDVDSWARDFLGSTIARIPGELDPAFKQRISSALQSPKCTIAALQAVVLGYYTATAAARALTMVPNIAFDSGQGGFDVSGGFDTTFSAPLPSQVIPDILVWDRMTQPALAAEFGVSEPEFVIQIGFKNPLGLAWFLDNSYLDNNTFLIADVSEAHPTPTSPDPVLATIVNFTKAAGTEPLYLTYELD